MGFADWRAQGGKRPVPAERSGHKVQAEESEEEDDDEGRQFVWDAAKGELVEAKKAEAEPATPAASVPPAASATPAEQAPPAGDGAKGPVEGAEAAPPGDGAEAQGAGGMPPAEAGASTTGKAGTEAGGAATTEESSDDEDDSDEEDVEAASREAFLSSASTPELIKQAVSVGGAMADGVKDRWVLDKDTKLYFRYNGATQQMHCWNPEQGCMYIWKERGKMDFLWASPVGPSATPPPLTAEPGAGGVAAPASAPLAAPAAPAIAATAPGQLGTASSSPAALWVTVIPPQVLVAGGVAEPDEKVSEEVEFSIKAFAFVIGKNGAAIKELEKRTGVTAIAQPEAEGETVRRLRLEGTRSQIADAKAMLDQQVVIGLGEKQAERMQKHVSGELLARKRAETGAEAAKAGVNGLSAFAETWGLKAVVARKLARLDAMLQRYLVRHFKPWKAKPTNALRAYQAALLKHPQRWRLEALYEDGELDGEVCETVAVSYETGAIIGRQSNVLGPEGGEEQFIELEVNEAMGGREAARTYGDVQSQHCRLMRMGCDYYAWAQESQIGTVVDGHKYREHDGPVPLRDGSVLGVGRYLLYCEVGEPAVLQRRRQRLLEGERFWKLASEAKTQEGSASQEGQQCQEDQGQEDEPGAEQGAESGASEEEEDEAEGQGVLAEGEEGSTVSRKRKREAGDEPDLAEESAAVAEAAAEEHAGDGEEDAEDGEAEDAA